MQRLNAVDVAKDIFRCAVEHDAPGIHYKNAFCTFCKAVGIVRDNNNGHAFAIEPLCQICKCFAAKRCV